MATATREQLPAAPHKEVPPGVEIPPIWCPIPAQRHPDVLGLDDRIIDWAKKADLIRSEAAAEHFHRAGFGRFAAAVYPRADRLELVAVWQVYNWIVDDQLDEGHVRRTTGERELLARALNAQLAPDLEAPAPTGPLTAALAELWQRTATPMSRAWRRRFAAHYRDFLMFTVLPHAQPQRYGLAGLPGFIRRRRLNSGCEMSFDLIEPANSTELPALVAETDAYRAVRLAANDVVSWTNDIFSVRKEIARGDEDHLAAVLRTTTGGWQEALDRAAEMVASLTQDFQHACQDLRAMRQLLPVAEAEWARVEDSLTDLGSWISGSLDWHSWSPRYREVATTAADQAPRYIEPHLI